MMNRILPALLTFLVLFAPMKVAGQVGQSLALALPDGSTRALAVAYHRGYPAFPAGGLETLGWALSEEGDGSVSLRHRTGLTLRFSPGTPFFAWDGNLLQLVDEPYWFGDDLHIPLQLLVDLLPGLLPQAYQYDPDRFVLAVEGASVDGISGFAPPSPDDRASAALPGSPPGGDSERPSRVVIIDPGHGGGDPGAIGPAGTREKDVALAIARELVRELSRDPDIEVLMTRDSDVEVHLWDRGEWATEWKGDRPGVFLSIHANALPDRPSVRGFETYFLSEARDEHERRVAALENAPLRAGSGGEELLAADPFLNAILRDLRAFDHQHWSADLAGEVQRELARFHPGPDRGVKQGPFAVITNSLMPSVLVEVGFLSNPEEERLLNDPAFHRDTAAGLAAAVRGFFERYPPGR